MNIKDIKKGQIVKIGRPTKSVYYLYLGVQKEDVIANVKAQLKNIQPIYNTGGILRILSPRSMEEMKSFMYNANTIGFIKIDSIETAYTTQITEQNICEFFHINKNRLEIMDFDETQNIEFYLLQNSLTAPSLNNYLSADEIDKYIEKEYAQITEASYISIKDVGTPKFYKAIEPYVTEDLEEIMIIEKEKTLILDGKGIDDVRGYFNLSRRY